MYVKQSTIREVVDVTTGEVSVIEDSKVYSEKLNCDKFYMTFIDYISPYYRLNSENARKILVWMCEHAEFNTGKVSLTAADRVKMAADIGICSNTITNNLKKLKELKLIDGEKGSFVINPQIFWKGDKSVRDSLLKTEEFKIKFSIEP